jgi:protein involved in polysaccharide export with SLBB domain
MIKKLRLLVLCCAWTVAASVGWAQGVSLPQVSSGGNNQISPSAIMNLLQQSGGSGGTLSAAPQAAQVATPAPQLPLPALPGAGGQSVVFGSQLFAGRFSTLSYSGFNPDYQIMTGDRVLVRMWGAVTYEAAQFVDAQGNIFIPNVGPVSVLNVRNTDLNKNVEDQVKRTFRANVGVYATLDAAQPVKIYVTGFVRAPGLYGGLSSDSVLNFLDKANGIDPDRGSYLTVQVSRAGKVRATLNLYDFLLRGRLESLQFQDGDMINVQPRKYAVTVTGEAQNSYTFELASPTISAAELMALATPSAAATHMSIVRNTGVQLKSEYFPLKETGGVTVLSGDLVTFTADKYPTTILIRVQGAQMGDRSVVMANGSKLKDLMAKLNPSPSANMAGLQMFRKSVQARQKVTLEISLRKLEAATLTARSATAEEAALRQVESNMMLAFIERARQVTPLGQVVLAGREQADEMTLEDGDVINIPERTNLVLISGEVLFPNAMLYNPKAELEDYIVMAGGLTQKADTSRQLVMRVDGSVAPVGQLPGPGDEIMVLPKIDSKNIEIARGLTQIIYQIAIAAKVALGL